MFCLLIERMKNARADEQQQHDLRHSVSADLTPLSIAKSIQLRPAIYYLPQAHAQSSRSAEEFAKFRYEGNFYQPLVAGQPVKRDMKPQLLRYYNQPPALYNHHVVHSEPWTTAKPLYSQYRKRRFNDHAAITPETIEGDVYPVDDQISDNSVKNSIVRKLRDDNTDSEKDAADAVVQDHQPTVDEIRYFHDIYMRLAGPHELNLFGHVEHGPHLSEKRFESQYGGNRFKGKVLWSDKTGGYGEHHWDLAQGKLS